MREKRAVVSGTTLKSRNLQINANTKAEGQAVLTLAA